MRQPGVARALAQHGQLRLEQHGGARQGAELEGRLIVVREVATRAQQMVQRDLEIVLVAVGEVRDLCVEQLPRDGRAPHPTLGADGEGVARRLLVGRHLTRHLDVIQHELTERRGRAEPFQIDAEKAVHVRVGVRGPEVGPSGRIEKPRLELASDARPDPRLPHGERPTPRQPNPQPARREVAVDGGPGRVGSRIELRRDHLQPDAGRAERHVQVIETVRVVRHEHALNPAWPPVPRQRAEEQLALAPLGADVGLGKRRRVVRFAVPIGIELQSGVDDGMAHEHDRAERQVQIQPGARESASHRQTRGHTTAQLERVAERVRGGRNARRALDPVGGGWGSGPSIGQRREQLPQRAAGDGIDARGVGRPERPGQVAAAERPGEWGRIRDHARRDQMLHVRHRPVLQRHVRRRLLCGEHGLARQDHGPDRQGGANACHGDATSQPEAHGRRI